jgi:hypothetical protein
MAQEFPEPHPIVAGVLEQVPESTSRKFAALSTSRSLYIEQALAKINQRTGFPAMTPRKYQGGSTTAVRL